MLLGNVKRKAGVRSTLSAIARRKPVALAEYLIGSHRQRIQRVSRFQ